MAKKPVSQVMDINEIEMSEITFDLVGMTPLIMHRFAQKAWRELLLPSLSVNKAERNQTLKHDPIGEFRGAIYMSRSDNEPTAIHVPDGAIPKALAQAGVDLPGASRAKLERLTTVKEPTIHLYGVPHVFCAMVRNSGIDRTPDVRTRPIFPEWACTVTVRYLKNVITERTIGNLLGGAGVIVGIGDWRPEKGGQHGTFRIAPKGDPVFKRIVKTQGREAQLKAIANPIFANPETEELLTWFEAELLRREREAPSQGAGGKRKRTAGLVDLLPPDVPVVTEDRQGNVVGNGQGA